VNGVLTNQPRTAASARDFRHALSHFATGVTVITTLDSQGQPAGTTVSAVASLSIDPPLVLVCLAQTSATLAALREHRAFAINVLSAEQETLSSHFARSGNSVSWDTVTHRISGGSLPHLDRAHVVIECELERSLEGGDHEIVIGRVQALDLTGSALEPLLHYRGAYAALAA
jgi:flavin reductase (DIM6/NTAB) family NADH-FMN oxidoreductase RutF